MVDIIKKLKQELNEETTKYINNPMHIQNEKYNEILELDNILQNKYNKQINEFEILMSKTDKFINNSLNIQNKKYYKEENLIWKNDNYNNQGKYEFFTLSKPYYQKIIDINKEQQKKINELETKIDIILKILNKKN